VRGGPGDVAVLATDAGFDFDELQRQPVRQPLAVLLETLGHPAWRALAHRNQFRFHPGILRCDRCTPKRRTAPEGAVNAGDDAPRESVVAQVAVVNLLVAVVVAVLVDAFRRLVADRPQPLERIEL